MVTVLGGLAEFERDLIKARTQEGRKQAQARGVRFGRKLKLTPHQRSEALARGEAGETLAEIGRSSSLRLCDLLGGADNPLRLAP
jgi:DNA invertase Pin-like site-specific DNA recombinase